MLCHFGVIDKLFDFQGGINVSSFKNQKPNRFEMQINPTPERLKSNVIATTRTQWDFDDDTCSYCQAGLGDR